MNIMVVNCGSSSVKYELFEMDKVLHSLAKGTAERIGANGSCIRHGSEGKEEMEFQKLLPDIQTAVGMIFEVLDARRPRQLKSLREIEAVGHRVVHGGQTYKSSVLVDDHVLKRIKQAGKFAPLHNPANIAGIEFCQQLLPGVPNIAVFDTAIHQTMPPKSYLYGLPVELYEKHGIRKYGFQGISHGYVARKVAGILNRSFNDLRIITCHLGNGSSITAFAYGESVDTSMGLTPLEGVVMATRCGDIDPAIVLHLVENLGLSPKGIGELLNRKSGLQGMCGRSDMRDIMEATNNGDARAQTAVDVFVYRIQKYIGAYIAAMNGTDAIAFTAGIGENSPYLRKRILANFGYIGLKLDDTRNEANRAIFSSDDSEVFALTVPTNEAIVIAQETYEVIGKNNS